MTEILGQILKFTTSVTTRYVSSFCKGLRKVRDDQKTHKNKELRKTGPVPDKAKPAAGGGLKAAAAPVKKPPVFELQGKKWTVVITVL